MNGPHSLPNFVKKRHTSASRIPEKSLSMVLEMSSIKVEHGPHRNRKSENNVTDIPRSQKICRIRYSDNHTDFYILAHFFKSHIANAPTTKVNESGICLESKNAFFCIYIYCAKFCQKARVYFLLLANRFPFPLHVTIQSTIKRVIAKRM